MAYIGKQPVVGNFQKCDAITVVNGQAAYTLNVGGSAVSPESVNHMLVSLNGVLQAPTDSFTVAGSTLTFASNLATGDVIDFVIILGDVLDLGAPSDNTVTAAKLNNDIISGQTALATAPDDTDEFLVSDAGTIKRIDYSLIKGGGMWEFISSTDVTSAVAQVDFTSFSTDYTDFCVVIQNCHAATDNQEFLMRYFYSDGSIVDGALYQWSFDGSDTSATQSDSNGVYQNKIVIGRPVGNATRESTNIEVTIYDVHDTGDTAITEGFKQCIYSQALSNIAAEFSHTRGGGWTKADLSGDYSISGVRFFWNSGNIASGRFSLYGRKHS